MTNKQFNDKKSPPLSRGRTKALLGEPRDIGRRGDGKEYQTQGNLILALEEVSKLLVTKVDLQEILEAMAEIIAKTLGAKWVNFWELTSDKKALYIAAMYGMKPEYVEQSRHQPIPLGSAWIGRAVKTGRAWATSDILNDPHLVKDLGASWKKAIERQDFRALLCVPTTSIRGPIGGMCVYYPGIHEFTDFEMRLVTIAANQAATSITNAQIFNELLVERNKTFAIIQSLQDGLIMYDLTGQVLFFNPRAEEFLQLKAEDVVGRQIKEESKTDVYWQNLFRISNLAQVEYSTKEFTIRGPQKLILGITSIPVRDQNYRKIGAMQTLHNITKEKELEVLKSNFVSTASHQLRTPLSAIKWALAILVEEKMGSLNQEQKDLLKKTFIANEYLINLVSQLLDISRIEEEKFGYNFALGSIEELAKTVFRAMEDVTKRQQIDFQFEPSATPLPKISFDKDKLEIAIRNVIDNAIRYTRPKGIVQIKVRLEKNSLFLIVKDNGIGIPKENQKFIFVKFFRARNAIKFQPEGSGLGLFIAKNIVEKHNAVLTFESEENKGTSFIFQFPLAPEKIPKGVLGEA